MKMDVLMKELNEKLAFIHNNGFYNLSHEEQDTHLDELNALMNLYVMVRKRILKKRT